MAQIQHADTNEVHTRVGKNSIRFGNDISSLPTGWMRSARTEHLENWPLPGIKKGSRVCELTHDSSPSGSFSVFRKCRFQPSTYECIDIKISG